jgi:hypothetical protein
MRIVCPLFVFGTVATAFVPTTVHRPRPGVARHAEKYSFEELRSLDSRLEKLEQNAPDVLGGFYESHLKSFSIVPGSAAVSYPSMQLCNYSM